MAKPSNPQVAITCIIGLFVVGVQLMVAHYSYYWVLLAGATIWLILFLFLRRQRVDIEVTRALINGKQRTRGHEWWIEVEGWITARHREELTTLNLLFEEHTVELLSNYDYSPSDDYYSPRSKMVDSTASSFKATFQVSFDIIIKEGREKQEQGRAIDFARLSAVTKSGIWLSEVFQIPCQLSNEGGWMTKLKKRLTARVKLRNGEPNITRKEYHELLIKASQPIKKSEKEKS